MCNKKQQQKKNPSRAAAPVSGHISLVCTVSCFVCCIYTCASSTRCRLLPQPVLGLHIQIKRPTHLPNPQQPPPSTTCSHNVRTGKAALWATVEPKIHKADPQGDKGAKKGQLVFHMRLQMRGKKNFGKIWLTNKISRPTRYDLYTNGSVGQRSGGKHVPLISTWDHKCSKTLQSWAVRKERCHFEAISGSTS